MGARRSSGHPLGTLGWIRFHHSRTPHLVSVELGRTLDQAPWDGLATLNPVNVIASGSCQFPRSGLTLRKVTRVHHPLSSRRQLLRSQSALWTWTDSNLEQMETALTMAVMHNRAGVAELLIQANADVNLMAGVISLSTFLWSLRNSETRNYVK